MRLRRLDLTRYGKFTDKVLDLGEAPATGPDLHIVYGANEAGKSTVFDAYLSLLFGIPAQTRYGFIHAYDALQIGGSLAFGERGLDMVRTKARTNDLFGPDGKPLPPGILGPVLGGLTRDVYQAMFSLNDRSLADGGRDILASRGELGAMLFAATSGLSELTAALDTTRTAADALHRPRARNTKFRNQLEQLATLKGEQQAVDVQADRFEQLRMEMETARGAHQSACAMRARLEKDRGLADRLQRALPLAARRRALLAEWSALPERPAPPAGWLETANELISDEVSLNSRLNVATETVKRLRAERDSLVLDTALLDAGATILALDGPRGRERAAREDLPKRLGELDDIKATIAELVAGLGPAAGGDGVEGPGALLLPLPVVAEIESCIERYGLLRSEVDAADAERRRAELKLDHERLRAARDASAAADPVDMDAIEALLKRIDEEAPQKEHARAARAVREQSAKLDAAIAALTPFHGSPERLLALPVPAAATVSRWGEALKQANADERLAAQHLMETEAAIAAAAARADALLSTAALVDEAGLQARQDAREHAWAALAASLDDGHTAADRQLAAARYAQESEAERQALRHNLRHAGTLGQWQATAVTLAEARAAEPVRRAAVAAARDAQRAIRANIDAALQSCDLPPGLHPEALLTWLTRREAALADLAALDALHEEEDWLAESLKQARAALNAALTAADCLPDDQSLPALRDAAHRALSDAREAGKRREGSRRALASLVEDLDARTVQRTLANERLQAWLVEWRAALDGTWLADLGAPPAPVAVKAALATMARLAPLLQAHAELEHRVARMREDETAFGHMVAAAHTAAGRLPGGDDPLAAADALHAALQAERQRAALRASVEGELARAEAQARELVADLAELGHRRAGMFAHYGVTSTEALRTALEEGRKRADLEERLRELAVDIVSLTDAPDLDRALAALAEQDADRLAADIQRLTTEISEADAAVQQSNHAWLSAEKAYRDVGGDDRVARIIEQRRTVELELKETVFSYLRLKIGVEAVETALRTYRDRHRSGMIEDAAHRFRHITGGSFTDLRTQAGDKGEILVGIRAGGGSLETEKMSQGTRDQLFLALRMAGYVEFARTREPLPFVADDIMETFDDDRAAATFRMLADVARQGQVIYLTHHRHLCAIAQDVCRDGARVVEL